MSEKLNAFHFALFTFLCEEFGPKKKMPEEKQKSSPTMRNVLHNFSKSFTVKLFDIFLANNNDSFAAEGNEKAHTKRERKEKEINVQFY